MIYIRILNYYYVNLHVLLIIGQYVHSEGTLVARMYIQFYWDENKLPR